MRGRKPELGNDPDAVKLAPRAPGWLSAQAKAEWRRIMPLLIERRILTEADMASVENYCVAIGQVRATEDIINREGFTIVTANGLRAHPAVSAHDRGQCRHAEPDQRQRGEEVQVYATAMLADENGGVYKHRR